jgi:nitric oxide reductase NorE protein
MWFFIVGDLIIFGLYFLIYMGYRGEQQGLFLDGQRHLNTGIGVLNTIVLLTSSLFVALGTVAARESKSGEAGRLFGAALAIGATFPVLKLFEWIPEIIAGLTPGANLFFTFYYVMTGLHLCHVLLGLVILGFVVHEVRSEQQPSIGFVETGAMYWHMVDLLWLLVFALFYLVR